MCGPREEFQLNGNWKEGIIVSLYKGKGSQSESSSYRPISLLSVSGKVFAHILLARIQPLLDKCRIPQQSGFTAGWSTMDAIAYSTSAADLNSLVLLPGGLLWMPY